jgi:hypothetical protein
MGVITKLDLMEGLKTELSCLQRLRRFLPLLNHGKRFCSDELFSDPVDARRLGLPTFSITDGLLRCSMIYSIRCIQNQRRQLGKYGLTQVARVEMLTGGWDTLYMHLDSARPYNAKQSTECLHSKTIHRISHRTCSPDLAPSNFFLIGDIKRKLTEYDILDQQRSKARSPTFSTKSDTKS